jgi:hypothetical protein
MSSGVLVLPLAALLVLPMAGAVLAVMAAAVVLFAAAASVAALAVMVARAAMAGARAVAGGIVRLGELMDVQREASIEAEKAAMMWQLAVTEVTERNARITALTAFARSVGAGPDVPIPPPCDLAGKSLCEVRDWCAATDERLAAAEAALEPLAVAASVGRARDLLPARSVDLVTAAETLANGQSAKAAAKAAAERAAATDAGRERAERVERAAVELSAEISARVDEALADLAPMARPDDRANVLRIAAKAVATDHLDSARTHADHLRAAIRAANRAVADVGTATRLLQGLRFDPRPSGVDELDLGAVVGELEAVVAGRRALDPELHERARAALCAIETAGLIDYLREQVSELMAKNNWAVKGDFVTLRPGLGHLDLTSEGWQEHRLRLYLDGNEKEVRYQTFRDFKVGGDDAARLDEHRCDQVTVVMKQVGAGLRVLGVDAKVKSADGPYVRDLGLATASAEPGAPGSTEKFGPMRMSMPEPGDEG